MARITKEAKEIAAILLENGLIVDLEQVEIVLSVALNLRKPKKAPRAASLIYEDIELPSHLQTERFMLLWVRRIEWAGLLPPKERVALDIQAEKLGAYDEPSAYHLLSQSVELSWRGIIPSAAKQRLRLLSESIHTELPMAMYEGPVLSRGQLAEEKARIELAKQRQLDLNISRRLAKEGGES